MAKPCKVPQDKKVYDQMIEDMAFNISCRLIGDALGVPERTVRGWKKRKDISRDLAVRQLEVLRMPIKAVYVSSPLTFLQMHPETKEDFAPVAQNVKGSLELIIRDCVKDD